MNAKRRANRTSARAVLVTEAVLSLALIGLVLTASSLLVTGYARSTDHLLNCRRVQLAAEAAAERLRVTGTCRPALDRRPALLPLCDDSFTDDAGISYRVQLLPAEAPWEPLTLVSITATVTGKHGRVARSELRTYIHGVQAEPGGRP